MNIHTTALNFLTAISPLDGRYRSATSPLQPYFSEFGLMHARVKIEIEWLIHLSRLENLQEVPPFSEQTLSQLQAIVDRFDLDEAGQVKEIEVATNHDVKAVEYYLKEKTENIVQIRPLREFIHFACTSEDINNLSYALLIRDARNTVLLPKLKLLIDTLHTMAAKYADQPMLSRTHGQPASPTTLGKEIVNFVSRLDKAVSQLETVEITGKINGAVGNFNAHYSAYPALPWPEIAKQFVHSLGIGFQPFSTQIEPHDYIAEFCHILCRVNTILIDLNRDIWGYIALGYLRQNVKAAEVGSSTMPHKVNPIDFENSEGNLGLANAMLHHFAEKLPISRWQRDLSDSTVLRNLGVGIGYALVAFESTLKGLNKLAVNQQTINADLDNNWQILAESIQTVMRRYGVPDSYEKLKSLTRGQQEITRESLHDFIADLDIPDPAKQSLLAMTPANYIGNASQAARSFQIVL